MQGVVEIDGDRLDRWQQRCRQPAARQGACNQRVDTTGDRGAGKGSGARVHQGNGGIVRYGFQVCPVSGCLRVDERLHRVQVVAALQPRRNDDRCLRHSAQGQEAALQPLRPVRHCIAAAVEPYELEVCGVVPCETQGVVIGAKRERCVPAAISQVRADQRKHRLDGVVSPHIDGVRPALCLRDLKPLQLQPGGGRCKQQVLRFQSIHWAEPVSVLQRRRIAARSCMIFSGLSRITLRPAPGVPHRNH